ncbi:hypothetical protein V8E54_013736 [Elaphomyces granulatus]
MTSNPTAEITDAMLHSLTISLIEVQELLLTGKTSKPMTCTVKITDPPPILHGPTVALIEPQQRGISHIHILSTDLMTSPTEPHTISNGNTEQSDRNDYLSFH